ncbi:MAG: hypothetical protein Athens101428_453 [Candidatus Berkelbacteria bacterium Athens1014_28]|uniref:DUF3800 domain-containing protein n=1 Tax=Candidatus Berkelbacteria bacterium Athens1014_28 TaxID=2017145 RepID=A0A554LMX7_9BACT|nr:MAG: hypothetical protein Athens101428_453 [Candidatus Berkelbacteria bacterium Athens1014_28]
MPNILQKNYIFLDESGKPEVFSSRGINLVEKNQASKYLVITAVRTQDQLDIQRKVTAFRSELLNDPELTKIFSSAYTLDAFHAQIDYPQVREKFYNFINSLIEIKINVIVVEKLKCYVPLQQNSGKLYGIMTGELLKNICHQSNNTEVIFSRKESKLKLQKELESEVERIRLGYLQLHPNFDAKYSLSYHHNPHYTHGALQIADYVSYSIFQVFENKNRKWYELIKGNIRTIQDICNKKYFTRSNPL